MSTAAWWATGALLVAIAGGVLYAVAVRLVLRTAGKWEDE